MDHAVGEMGNRRRPLRRFILLGLAIAALASAYKVGYWMGDTPHSDTAAFCIEMDPGQLEPGSDIPLVSFDPRSDPCPSQFVICGYLTRDVRVLRDIDPASFRSERCPFRR